MTGSHPDALPARVEKAVSTIKSELQRLRLATTDQARERAHARISSELDELLKLASSKATGSSRSEWVTWAVRMLGTEIVKEILHLLSFTIPATRLGRTRKDERRTWTYNRAAAGERRPVSAETRQEAGRVSFLPLAA